MNRFNRDSDSFIRGERVAWLDRFADSLEAKSKTAVEVARERDQTAMSLQDQIQNIMGNPKKSVNQKVEELQERTGLKSYLNKVYSSYQKKAQERIFPEYSEYLEEKIKQFIHNLVSTHHGYIPVLAVQEEILNHFSNMGVLSNDINTRQVASFINNVIINEQSLHGKPYEVSNELGKNLGLSHMDGSDPENSDFMHNLMPQK